MTRRRHVDWLRGLAVLVMILWHAVDAWTLDAVRTGATFWVVKFFGGWAAPSFLFLAGVSVPLAGAARTTRGQDRLAVGRSLTRRAWEIFLIAHVFRLQSFLFNGARRWSAILKPDILNILGLGLVAVSWCWRRIEDARRQRAAFIGLALLFVILTPFALGWWWPTLLYPRFEAYIRPVDNLGVFALFPWVGYIFGGAWVGSFMATETGAERDTALHRWFTTVGAWALGVGLVFGLTAVHLPSVAWLVPALAPFLWRSGSMILALVLARRYWEVRSDRWSPMVLFGRTSLFVYWVHVELAYGVISRPWHKSLSLTESLTAYAGLTVLMLGLAALWQRRHR